MQVEKFTCSVNRMFKNDQARYAKLNFLINDLLVELKQALDNINTHIYNSLVNIIRVILNDF